MRDAALKASDNAKSLEPRFRGPVACQPTARRGTGEWCPGAAAVLGAEHARRIQRRWLAHRPAALRIFKANLQQSRQRARRHRHPVLSAIASPQHGSSALSRRRLVPPADNPAMLRVGEPHRFPAATRRRFALPPLSSTVARRPDRSPIANRPAMFGIKKEDIRQLGIG